MDTLEVQNETPQLGLPDGKGCWLETVSDSHGTNCRLSLSFGTSQRIVVTLFQVAINQGGIRDSCGGNPNRGSSWFVSL